MHGIPVRPLRKKTAIGAARALSLALCRFGVAPLVFAVGVAPLACSPTDNTQPRNMPSAQGGATGGSSTTAQGGSSGVTARGGALSTGGTVATGTGGNTVTGGQATGGSTGGSVATGGTGVAGSATGGQPAATGGSSGSAGGGAKGGGGANAGGGASGAAAGGKSSGGSGGAASGGVAGSAGSAGAAGSGGAATCPGFVFCDTFEDGNLTSSPAWLATAGAFSVVDDGGSKVMKQQASSEAWSYSGSATWTDVTITARVKVLDFMGTSTSNCAGIIARWQGSSNPNYMASLCAKGSVGIYKDGGLVDETNGTKAANIVANTWYALKFKVSGKPGSVSLALSIDDAPVITITDTDTSTPVTAGYVAVGSKKAFNIEYDDVKVSSP